MGNFLGAALAAFLSGIAWVVSHLIYLTLLILYRPKVRARAIAVALVAVLALAFWILAS